MSSDTTENSSKSGDVSVKIEGSGSNLISTMDGERMDQGPSIGRELTPEDVKKSPESIGVTAGTIEAPLSGIPVENTRERQTFQGIINSSGSGITISTVSTVDSQYIEPSKRRLSPDLQALVNEPVKTVLGMDPMDYQLTKVLAIAMEARGYHCSQEFLHQLTDLTVKYLHDIISTLRECTQLQRRRKPTLSDVKLFLRLRHIDPQTYIREIEDSKGIISADIKSQIETVEKETIEIQKNLESQELNLDENDPSLPFFTNEHYQIAELVPRGVEKPSYIPSYFPDLPPDYTYQNTPQYMKTLTDLKELRLKLVEESRLTEKSLYNLIEDDEKQWRLSFEKELSTMPEVDESDNENSVMSEGPNDRFNASDVETPLPEEIILDKKPEPEPTDKSEQSEENAVTESSTDVPALGTEEPKEASKVERKVVETKAFDIVAYAEKRRQIFLKKEEEIIKKKQLRESNIYMKAETYYSPYADGKRTSAIDSYFKNIIDEEFKSVIKGVRIAETRKRRKIEEILAEKARKEREEQEKNTIEFGFPGITQASDDDDSDEDNDQHQEFPDFNFASDVPATVEIGVKDANPETEVPVVTIGSKTIAASDTKTSEVQEDTHLSEPTGIEPGNSFDMQFDHNDSDIDMSDDLEAELESAMRSEEEDTNKGGSVAQKTVPQITSENGSNTINIELGSSAFQDSNSESEDDFEDV
ncbi:uncharacterized protein RJT20DRAFT_131706 [Scheffersomyces xylosifermentans]|uniref:uncharacterized protein n=1 Tax=Scheffersomyces xylosifermentans TaxID=1304137 RepID=UPI00315DD684